MSLKNRSPTEFQMGRFSWTFEDIKKADSGEGDRFSRGVLTQPVGPLGEAVG